MRWSGPSSPEPPGGSARDRQLERPFTFTTPSVYGPNASAPGVVNLLHAYEAASGTVLVLALCVNGRGRSLTVWRCADQAQAARIAMGQLAPGFAWVSGFRSPWPGPTQRGPDRAACRGRSRLEQGHGRRDQRARATRGPAETDGGPRSHPAEAVRRLPAAGRAAGGPPTDPPQYETELALRRAHGVPPRSRRRQPRPRRFLAAVPRSVTPIGQPALRAPVRAAARPRRSVRPRRPTVVPTAGVPQGRLHAGPVGPAGDGRTAVPGRMPRISVGPCRPGRGRPIRSGRPGALGRRHRQGAAPVRGRPHHARRAGSGRRAGGHAAQPSMHGAGRTGSPPPAAAHRGTR